jgi:hypothetical protein
MGQLSYSKVELLGRGGGGGGGGGGRGHHHHHGGGGGYYPGGYVDYGPGYGPEVVVVQPTTYTMSGYLNGKPVQWVAPIADYAGQYYAGAQKPTGITVVAAV